MKSSQPAFKPIGLGVCFLSASAPSLRALTSSNMVPALDLMREWPTDAWIPTYRQSSLSVRSRPRSRQEALISNVLFLGYGTLTESVNTDLFILEDALESGVDVKGGFHRRIGEVRNWC